MSGNKLAIYRAENGAIELPIDATNETIWASQKQIAEVFDVDVRTINEHLGNIFRTDELDEDSTIRKFRIVQIEGNREVTRSIEYNRTQFLQAIDDLKLLAGKTDAVGSTESLDLVEGFVNTWPSLQSYELGAKIKFNLEKINLS